MHSPSTGVLLINLGTPQSFQPADVRRYLTEFLTDGRVIDIPWLWRQLLVRMRIVPKRYRQSAASYRAIWTDEGSPLLVYGQRLKVALGQKLGSNYTVALAMRYQEPSLEQGLAELLNQHIEHLIVLPLFPQYASATTGSINEKVMQLLSTRQAIPSVSFISHYFADPYFIDALAAVAAPYSVDNYDRILFSFHGLPQRQLTKANPSHCTPATQACCIQNSSCQKLCYSAQCRATAYALQAKLNLPTDKCRLCFQSRLGNEPWLEPFTSEVIAGCAKAGDKRLLLFCPAFTADCLETLFEIGVEYRDEFLAAGGLQLDLVPSLNDHPAWVEALYQLVLKRGHKVLELEAQFSS